LVAAHYDHVGYGSRSNSFGPWGYVHNGADDNASGTSGLLEVLDAVVALGTAPRRSILFAFFDGEEKGLLGSQKWTSAPTIPLEQIITMVNCDMIGRLQDERVEVYGSRTAPGLRRLVCESNRFTNLALDFNWEMKNNSDHYTFFTRSIPVVMLHTGLHGDYHRPSDDADRVNAAGMQEVARLLFTMIHELADRPEVCRFRVQSSQESPRDARALETPLGHPAPRLGVVSEEVAGDRPGLIITEVLSGTPAQRAGLRVGDRWLRFAGKPVQDLPQFRLDILLAQSPVEVVLERTGMEQPVVFQVNLAGEKVRVGVSWREDEAEPGTVVLAQVVYGSPAQVAGLVTGDRVYQVNDSAFRDGAELQGLLHSLAGTVRLRVERGGRFRTAILQLPDSNAAR
jgi:hypothetical protein